jgi:hypothetical protein
MPLQNRVDAFGDLIAVEVRGTVLGNRGGRFHRDDRTLGKRRHVSRQWICCRLEFNGRHRDVWGKCYTELFFLDEVTAFSAGHRPCFECRRKDAEAFAALWPYRTAPDRRPRAAEMDLSLQSERLDGRLKREHPMRIDELPDGTMIAVDGFAWAVCGKNLLRWSFTGYWEKRSRPVGSKVSVLTPPSIVAVLRAGYVPQWHPTAGQPLVPKNSKSASVN